MNLKQAKEEGKLDQFIKEQKHIKGDGAKFEKLINSVCKKSSKTQEASPQGSS
jgi:hypothetical protein